MASIDEIWDQVRLMVADIADLPVEKIFRDSVLADLDIDSLRGLRIVAEVEKRYGIVIPDSEIGKIRSMQDIFALIDKHGSKA